MKKKLIVLFLFSSLFTINLCFAMSQKAKDKGFVYLNDVDPTIIVSLRYATNENFVGKPVDGYKKSVLMLTNEAAQALKKAQEIFKKDGYCIVVYDAYRPQPAVDHFYRWSQDIKDQLKKEQYYPRVDKTKVLELGYVATSRSGHTRGSTVDLTIIKDGESLHDIKEKDRKLLDGYTIKFLDDGTVDMGSSFDLFDVASHYESNLIEEKYKKLRTYLKDVMEKCGFKNYTNEWWHFTLKNEPYPAGKDRSYFNFAIE